MIKSLSLILATCSIGLCNDIETSATPSLHIAKADSLAANVAPEEEDKPPQTRTNIKDLMAGNYLASRFAQSQHDWSNASTYITPLLSSEISQSETLQRAMVIAMGAGDAKRAIELAHRAKDIAPDKSNTIAEIFLITEAFKKKEYDNAYKIFNALDDDPTVNFIGPFVRGWLDAAQGKANVKDLKQNTVQLYHGILISDFLDDHTEVEQMIDKALKVEDVAVSELERIADLYGHVGIKEKAINIYQTILSNHPDDEIIKNKINNLKNGTQKPLFDTVKTAHQGMAQAFYDIARILHNERNDESSRVFAHISRYIAPDLSKPMFLLAEINTNYKQYDKAISYYQDVPKSDKEYMQAQFEIVDIYDQTNQFDKALAMLNKLSKKEKNPDILIRIGDLYRHQSQYDKALAMYNRAVDAMGSKIPEDYWHIYYVRGIAYEQTNNWEAAEKDLTTALSYQPNHPYVLNYLGYSWADKGINLDKATSMIQKAVDVRPTDGYITDSLGWVMFRNSDYKNAVSVLERAVELLPYDPTINDHLGDAYWKVGRKLEARFQWERAKNHSKDDEQIGTIASKLKTGLKNTHGVISN